MIHSFLFLNMVTLYHLFLLYILKKEMESYDSNDFFVSF